MSRTHRLAAALMQLHRVTAVGQRVCRPGSECEVVAVKIFDGFASPSAR
jgi:hypothetical protein